MHIRETPTFSQPKFVRYSFLTSNYYSVGRIYALKVQDTLYVQMPSTSGAPATDQRDAIKN